VAVIKFHSNLKQQKDQTELAEQAKGENWLRSRSRRSLGLLEIGEPVKFRSEAIVLLTDTVECDFEAQPRGVR